MIKTYSELITLSTFEERYEYLRLDGNVGVETFGFERYLNQKFYSSKEWKNIRDEITTRDNGCDLACDGYEIFGRVYIHHINPVSLGDIKNISDFLINPEYLITTTFETHNAIHYGNENYTKSYISIERNKNDTCPWKNKEV